MLAGFHLPCVGFIFITEQQQPGKFKSLLFLFSFPSSLFRARFLFLYEVVDACVPDRHALKREILQQIQNVSIRKRIRTSYTSLNTRTRTPRIRIAYFVFSEIARKVKMERTTIHSEWNETEIHLITITATAPRP